MTNDDIDVRADGENVRGRTPALDDQLARLAALEARLRATLEPPTPDDTAGPPTRVPHARRWWHRGRV